MTPTRSQVNDSNLNALLCGLARAYNLTRKARALADSDRDSGGSDRPSRTALRLRLQAAAAAGP